jgi:hypothetical protein
MSMALMEKVHVQKGRMGMSLSWKIQHQTVTYASTVQKVYHRPLIIVLW